MALPADQLSRVPPLKILITDPWRVPLQTGKPTAPEPGDLHAASRLTDAVTDRAERAVWSVLQQLSCLRYVVVITVRFRHTFRC
jgi:hypothetical protein